ncbi:MAG: putative metal dependent phosphohydrolase protein [Peptococcaceae bacterium]|jgi:putative nucleotidyltransferase with HDIG domain|nr:putative metal dependent phosphohydrolase protein [Peptococcaceae bacterium]
MRAIDINQLKEGMKIAKTIYDDAGRILLNAGTVLTPLYIKKLDQFGIPFIYVEDEIIGPLQVEDVIHDTVRIQTVKALREVVSKAKIQSDVDFTVVNNMVNKILDDLKSTPNLLVQLMDSRSANMYLYNHSVGVCVLSVVTGMALGLDDLKLKTLAMGAILHDIGKSLSPGPEHTIHGFEILRNNKILNIMVGHVAYQHHEKYDGTGYPRQLKGEDIHLFAAITGVANFYDNLVMNLNPEKRLYPYQAIELVVAESGRSFHPEIVKAFSRNIAPYPVGTAVRLNNGAVGVVVSVPRNYPTRPVVKIVTNHVGVLLTTFPEVDLLQEKTLFINEILSEKERQEIL